VTFRTALIPTALLLATCGLLHAQTTQPAAAPAAKATTQPAPTTVVATVGETKITSDRLDGPLKALPEGFPADRIPMVKAKVLNSIIMGEMIHNFLEEQKAPFDPNTHKEFLTELKNQATERGVTLDKLMLMYNLTDQKIRDRVRLTVLAKKETTDEKIDALIKAHPKWFSGATVTASHILIKCDPTAPTADQKAAIKKLEKIAANIKAGKTTFEEAAAANSDCPSGKRDKGSLGEFEFAKMVPPFSMKAFEMEKGEVSGVFRTSFGFHIIKLTERGKESGKPDPAAKMAAKNCLISMLEGRLFDQALTTLPIVIMDKK